MARFFDVFGQQVVVDLLTQGLQRVGLAGILGELVVERRQALLVSALTVTLK